jgi:hypothetical protein
MLIYTEGGKPENPEKNPRSKGENQQQTQLTYDTKIFRFFFIPETLAVELNLPHCRTWPCCRSSSNHLYNYLVQGLKSMSIDTIAVYMYECIHPAVECT